MTLAEYVIRITSDMKFVGWTLIAVLFGGVIQFGFAFEYNWEIDETPEGAESATVVEPVQVVLLVKRLRCRPIARRLC